MQAQQNSTGTRYTTTVALLAIAFIFIPTILMVSRPFGYLTLSLAIACSALCVTVARILWKKSSRLFVQSIATQAGRAK